MSGGISHKHITIHEHLVTYLLFDFLTSFICLVSVELAGPVTACCAGKIPTLMDTQTRNSNARMSTVKR